MLQPFEIFTPQLLTRLQELGRNFLVSQTYYRAEGNGSPDSKINLLLTDYPAAGQARLHRNAVKTDPYAAIIDLVNDGHKKKMEEMLSPASRYRIYFAAVHNAKQLENQVNALYRDHMKRYIDKYTQWRLNRSVTLKPSLEVTFGELFIILRHGKQTIRVKFSEIEAL